MTVPVQSALSGPFTGNGATTVFPFSFSVGSAGEISVSVDGITVSNFTATAHPDQGASPGGSVTFASPPAIGAAIFIASNPVFDQEVSFENAGAFLPATHDLVNDRAAIRDIYLRDGVNRSLRVPAGENVNLMPSVTQRAGKFLAFGGDGQPISASGTGSDANLRTDLAATAGSALVGWIRAATNAVARTISAKLSAIVDVEDFGADSTGVADSYAAFAAAVASLPASGGHIRALGTTYQLSAQPTTGTKSIHWEIGPHTAFTGAGAGSGLFRYMITNPAQMAVGDYIVSKTNQVSAAANGGVNPMAVEIDPTATGAGQWVAAFFGARASIANSSANHWSINTMMRVESTALGTQTGIEVDVDNFAASATVKGISVSGGGTQNPLSAIEVTRLAMQWGIGLTISKCTDSIVVTPTASGRGLVIHSPTVQVQGVTNSAITARQFVNNADTIVLQRFTDSSPTGYLWRAVNAANSANLFSVDVAGNLTSAAHTITAATPTTSTGQLGIGTTTATTATAGANGAVPAQVLGYLVMNLAGTAIKVPYYAV